MYLSNAEQEIIRIIQEHKLVEIKHVKLTHVLAERRGITVGTIQQQLNRLYIKFKIEGKCNDKLAQLNELLHKNNYTFSGEPVSAEPSRTRVLNRSTRKCELPNTFTPEQAQQMLKYFDYKCAVCGTPQTLFEKLEFDHWIPLASDDCPGTVATNMIPLCENNSGLKGHIGCNASKSDKDGYKWLIKKYGKRKANKINQRIQGYFDSIKGL